MNKIDIKQADMLNDMFVDLGINSDYPSSASDNHGPVTSRETENAMVFDSVAAGTAIPSDNNFVSPYVMWIRHGERKIPVVSRTMHDRYLAEVFRRYNAVIDGISDLLTTEQIQAAMQLWTDVWSGPEVMEVAMTGKTEGVS